MKRTSERIVKFHSLAQFVSNFSDNSVSSLFFRASRIFCPKAAVSYTHLDVYKRQEVLKSDACEYGKSCSFPYWIGLGDLSRFLNK